VFTVDLTVMPKPGVKDPQAEAVQESLVDLGYSGAAVHAVGRRLTMTIECGTEERARELADDMCTRLLVNPNLETYSLEVTKAWSADADSGAVLLQAGDGATA
jgi:phosphoribosylformylglycinamidine synthase